MSQSTTGGENSAIKLGDVFPSQRELSGSGALYVSLSELVMGKLFYHPSLSNVDDIEDATEKASLQQILSQQDVKTHFISTLVESIVLAAKGYDVVRIELNSADSEAMSRLIAGSLEPHEQNPLLGLRGVSRFASDVYKEAFGLEGEVIKALQQRGVEIDIVVPFVRALSDAAKIIDLLAEQGLPRGLKGLKVLYCCDTPSAVLMAEKLLHYFDGLVINLDTLAQLTLGVDNNNPSLAYLYDPENDSVIQLVDFAVKSANATGKPALLLTRELSERPRLEHYLSEVVGVETYLFD
jgi:pyruvate,water dikinase